VIVVVGGPLPPGLAVDWGPGGRLHGSVIVVVRWVGHG
jgi:hypothetical protein